MKKMFLAYKIAQAIAMIDSNVFANLETKIWDRKKPKSAAPIKSKTNLQLDNFQTSLAAL